MNTLKMLKNLYLNDKATNKSGRTVFYNSENKLVYEDNLEPFIIDFSELYNEKWEIKYSFVDYNIALNAYINDGNDIVLYLNDGEYLFVNESYDSFEKLHLDGISLKEFIEGEFRIVPKFK